MEILKDMAMWSLLPFALAFAVTLVAGPVFIPWLTKLKFGQEIREDGPKWHQKKSGTPTMGGIMFILGILVSLIITCVILAVNGNLNTVTAKCIVLFAVSLCFGVVGFIDDYIKVVKKRNLGLKAMEKFILQLVFAIGYVIAMYIMGELNTAIKIPFTTIMWEMPLWLYIPFVLFVVVGVVNAVNLTDGLDGLATSVTFVVALFFTIISSILCDYGNGIFSASVCGGLLAFFIYNHHPAKIFMGDTGSLFLGAAVALMGINMQMPLYLILVGFVYFAETLSVIMQTTYFKITKKKYGEGRRIFKMTPIHHHFEMCGWNEWKIVGVATLVTLILCVIAFIALFI